MVNKLIETLVTDKEKELKELYTINEYLNELGRLNRLRIYITIDDTNILITYKDTMLIMAEKSSRQISKYIIEYFIQAVNGVDFYISGFSTEGTIGNRIGRLLEHDFKNCNVYELKVIFS